MFKKHPWAKAGLIVAVLLACHILAFGWVVRVPQGMQSLMGNPAPPTPVCFATTHRTAANALALVFAPAMALLDASGGFVCVTPENVQAVADAPSLWGGLLHLP